MTSILNQNFMASVAERDIDLLIIEELRVNPEFATWLVVRTWGSSLFKESIGAWHSVTQGSRGESDIIFVFVTLAGTRNALLIENKISAAAQPEQAERYRVRGDHGTMAGDWKDFRTCVIAPSAYFAAVKQTGSYDYEVSYEEIMAFFASRSTRDARFEFKSHLVHEAIRQNRRGFVQVVSIPVTTFFKAYYHQAAIDYPDLGAMPAGGRAAGNTWMLFRPPGYPDNVQLAHQTASGFAKLFFDGQVDRFEEICGKLNGHVDSSMEVRPAGKSVSITVRVPPVSPARARFEDSRASVVAAMEALARLDKTYRAAFAA